MKISNVRVYGLEESIIASGYPFRTEVPAEEEFDGTIMSLMYARSFGTDGFSEESKIETERYLRRIKNLANAKSGSGHDCFLKGIIVQYDLTAPEYFWRQFDRYHFHDYISSQSKMHCMVEFDLKEMVSKDVDSRVVEIVNEYISIYNDMVADNLPKDRLDEAFEEIVANCPMGLELTARITDNYLQLKSKYNQRGRVPHKLSAWKHYCDWIKTLPMANELIIGGNVNE